MSKGPEPLYLKPRDVAKLLNLSSTTVYTLCLSGELPSIRIGGSVRINAEAFQRWCKEQEQKRLDDTAVPRYR